MNYETFRAYERLYTQAIFIASGAIIGMGITILGTALTGTIQGSIIPAIGIFVGVTLGLSSWLYHTTFKFIPKKNKNDRRRFISKIVLTVVFSSGAGLGVGLLLNSFSTVSSMLSASNMIFVGIFISLVLLLGQASYVYFRNKEEFTIDELPYVIPLLIEDSNRNLKRAYKRKSEIELEIKNTKNRLIQKINDKEEAVIRIQRLQQLLKQAKEQEDKLAIKEAERTLNLAQTNFELIQKTKGRIERMLEVQHEVIAAIDNFIQIAPVSIETLKRVEVKLSTVNESKSSKKSIQAENVETITDEVKEMKQRLQLLHHNQHLSF